MQYLSTYLGDNKLVQFGVLFGIVIAAVLLLLLIARLVFGRRLRANGGARGRQPRLGVVDAFDLDRQRQLVIVRRDNVEHLLMIGGPNDVVIEREIIRSQAVTQGLSRETTGQTVHPDLVRSQPAAVEPPPPFNVL